MSKAIRIHETGGPEVLRWEDVETGSPGAGQVRLKQSACGLNYIDVYGRSGLYPIAEFPATLGMEAVGIIEELGEGVEGLKAGDRVAYAMQIGAYSEERLIDARHLIKIPDSISDETAAAMMLKGLTAHYLLFRTYPVKPGDTILVYAAAGGVGLILSPVGETTRRHRNRLRRLRRESRTRQAKWLRSLHHVSRRRYRQPCTRTH